MLDIMKRFFFIKRIILQSSTSVVLPGPPGHLVLLNLSVDSFLFKNVANCSFGYS